MHIEIPYTPRPFQQELHDLLDQHRFAVHVTNLYKQTLLDELGEMLKEDGKK